jgi:hypothetical protein
MDCDPAIEIVLRDARDVDYDKGDRHVEHAAGSRT